jgi:fructan beta-fructosidase
MNDPNGLVYHKGVYHLFYQYHPKSSVWGPMHWGHATSKDMLRWKHEPVALYPDSLGTIFSGSAVVDINNTSGFGKNGEPPLVAIFTHHDSAAEARGRNDFQNQSLAYSNDNGHTWTKYAGNPVLRSPNIRDFRDPKVFWHGPTGKWIMTLAAVDQVIFFSSPNLKEWSRESEFGKNAGAHGGVWECPDLFPLKLDGKDVWVLIVNINPGGPNKGSATQYFLGDFDGKKFTAQTTDTRWLDYGPDEYAGVTFSNTGDRKVFLGWMSNWDYAQQVPTQKWRSAMTLPRELQLVNTPDGPRVASVPVKEINSIRLSNFQRTGISVQQPVEVNKLVRDFRMPGILKLSTKELKEFTITLSNNRNEELIIGFDEAKNQFYIDRTRSGKKDFHKGFAAVHTAPRFSAGQAADLTLIIDVSSMELFADGGLTTMTEIFFPTVNYDKIVVQSPGKLLLERLEYARFADSILPANQ